MTTFLLCGLHQLPDYGYWYMHHSVHAWVECHACENDVCHFSVLKIDCAIATHHYVGATQLLAICWYMHPQIDIFPGVFLCLKFQHANMGLATSRAARNWGPALQNIHYILPYCHYTHIFMMGCVFSFECMGSSSEGSWKHPSSNGPQAAML